MDSDRSYRLDPAHMLGAIDALQQVIAAILRELPEPAARAVAQEVSTYARMVQYEAEDRDRDDFRNRASAAFETAELLETVVRHHAEGGSQTLHNIRS